MRADQQFRRRRWPDDAAVFPRGRFTLRPLAQIARACATQRFAGSLPRGRAPRRSDFKISNQRPRKISRVKVRLAALAGRQRSLNPPQPPLARRLGNGAGSRARLNGIRHLRRLLGAAANRAYGERLLPPPFPTAGGIFNPFRFLFAHHLSTTPPPPLHLS